MIDPPDIFLDTLRASALDIAYADPDQAVAVGREAWRVRYLLGKVDPTWRFHLLVPLTYSPAFDGILILDVPVSRRDVPFPMAALLPEGVDSPFGMGHVAAGVDNT